MEREREVRLTSYWDCYSVGLLSRWASWRASCRPAGRPRWASASTNWTALSGVCTGATQRGKTVEEHYHHYIINTNRVTNFYLYTDTATKVNLISLQRQTHDPLVVREKHARAEGLYSVIYSRRKRGMRAVLYCRGAQIDYKVAKERARMHRIWAANCRAARRLSSGLCGSFNFEIERVVVWKMIKWIVNSYMYMH